MAPGRRACSRAAADVAPAPGDVAGDSCAWCECGVIDAEGERLADRRVNEGVPVAGAGGGARGSTCCLAPAAGRRDTRSSAALTATDSCMRCTR